MADCIYFVFSGELEIVLKDNVKNPRHVERGESIGTWTDGEGTRRKVILM